MFSRYIGWKASMLSKEDLMGITLFDKVIIVKNIKLIKINIRIFLNFFYFTKLIDIFSHFFNLELEWLFCSLVMYSYFLKYFLFENVLK
jgi:hypothetical protein